MKYEDVRVNEIRYCPPNLRIREHCSFIKKIIRGAQTIEIQGIYYFFDNNGWMPFRLTGVNEQELLPTHITGKFATSGDISRIPKPWDPSVAHLEPKQLQATATPGFKIELKRRVAIEANKNAAHCTKCGQPTKEVTLFSFSTRFCPACE